MPFHVHSRDAQEPFYLFFQITSTSKSIQPSEVTITTSRLSETGKIDVIDPHNFDYQFGSLGKYIQQTKFKKLTE